MKEYQFSTAGRIIAGAGSVGRIPLLLNEWDVGRVAVVSDQGVVAAGIVDEVRKPLQAAGISVDLYADVVPEPTVKNVEAIAQSMANAAERGQYDLIVGVGGGSSLDAAKAVAASLAEQRPAGELLGTDTLRMTPVPTVLIPTTAGTGSEATPNAILGLPEQGKKAAIVSGLLLPRLAVLDPALTVGLPPATTAATGMDALVHCLECYIGKKANPVSDAVALRGIRLISTALRRAFACGSDLQAREQMLVGSLFGGMAIAASGTAAVHALAYPLGGRYHVPHGVANSMLLAPVMRFTLPACAERLADVAEAMQLSVGGSVVHRARAVARELELMVGEVGIPRGAREFGMHQSDLEELSLAAAGITRLLDNNPRAMSPAEIRAVYEELL